MYSLLQLAVAATSKNTKDFCTALAVTQYLQAAPEALGQHLGVWQMLWLQYVRLIGIMRIQLKLTALYISHMSMIDMRAPRGWGGMLLSVSALGCKPHRGPEHDTQLCWTCTGISTCVQHSAPEAGA